MLVGIERGPGKGKILGQLSLSTLLESPPPSGVNLLFPDKSLGLVCVKQHFPVIQRDLTKALVSFFPNSS